MYSYVGGADLGGLSLYTLLAFACGSGPHAISFFVYPCVTISSTVSFLAVGTHFIETD